MNINTNHGLGDLVYIKPIECNGRVREIRMTLYGFRYVVDYWLNSKAECAEVCESELDLAKVK